MHSLTKEEIATFKAFQARSRAARNVEDMRTLKRDVAAWINEVKSPGGRQLRLNISRAIRGAYANFPETKGDENASR